MATQALSAALGLAPPAVHRTRLLSQLDDAQRQRLTLVVAPAGYGKTMLLTQWAEAHTGRLVTWLTITAKHNEPGRLVADLRRMLGAGSETTAVLDDFHRVTNAAVLNEVAALVEQLPPVHNLVVATRVDPPNRYYRLRLSDSLSELQAADLAFTCDEAAEYVERTAGEAPDPAQVDLLQTRTEGWAAGIDGDDARTNEYLTAEVLDQQPDHIRRFLLITSVLERLSGLLCDFVTDSAGGQATLNELARTGVLI